MKKRVAKSISLILLLLTILFGREISQPVLSTTVAVEEDVVLTANLEVPFTTAFDYGYKLELSLKGDTIPIGGRLKAVLNKIGDQDTINLLDKKLALSSEGVLIGQHFVAQGGDHFLFKVTDIDSVLVGKTALLYADTGGAPSVGLAIQRDFRPYFRVFFVLLLSLTLIIGCLAWRK
jgi:hypothetical protein